MHRTVLKMAIQDKSKVDGFRLLRRCLGFKRAVPSFSPKAAMGAFWKMAGQPVSQETVIECLLCAGPGEAVFPA